jgi:hypothetical protein
VTTVASCGSSPNSYRDDKPVYTTKCSYLKRDSTGEDYLPWEKIRKTAGKPTPKLQAIFHGETPDLAIVQQGTNLYRLILGNSLEKGTEAVAQQVFEFLKSDSFRAKACLWVGPPQISKYYGERGGMVRVRQEQMQAMNNGIRRGLERAAQGLSAGTPGKRCRFMDSLPVTEPPLGDGIHHGHATQTDKWLAEAKKESLALLRGSPLPDLSILQGSPKALDPSHCTIDGNQK